MFESLSEKLYNLDVHEKLFKKTDLLLRENATEKELRKKVLGDYKIIHFATHGITSKTIDNENLPGLILTPELNGKWFNDGYLSSSEIMEFDLSADLVILSACNTGVNRTRNIISGFGDLTQSRSNVNGLGDGIRGIFTGGYTGSNQTTMDYISVADTGNAVDFGDLNYTSRAAAGLSNAHGGL